MRPRRSKLVPDPLVYPDRPTVPAEAAPQAAADVDAATTKHGATNPTTSKNSAAAARPRLFRVASPSLAQPAAMPTVAGATTSNSNSTELLSPGLNVYRGGAVGVLTSISPKTTVLVEDHVTNSGAVVRFERVDYSKAMRAYRVCRQERGLIQAPSTVADTAWTPASAASGGGGVSLAGNAIATPSSGAGGSSVASPSAASVIAAGAAQTTPSSSPPPLNGTVGTSSGNVGGAAAGTNGRGNGGAAATTGAAAGTAAAAAASMGANTSVNSAGGVNRVPAPCHTPASWRVVLMRLFGAADMVLLAICVACFVVLLSRLRLLTHGDEDSSGMGIGRRSVMSQQQIDALPSPSSSSQSSWFAAALLSLVGGRAGLPSAGASCNHGREGHEHASTASSQCEAAAASASYTLAIHSPALDASVTIALLVISFLVLCQRLSSAFSRVYVEEVLVMRGVGLQFSAYGIFNTLRYKVFVDLLMLRSLVIHDAFFRYQPMFFLSSSVENRAERMVFFPDTLPRLVVLRHVLNGIRGVLYGEPEEGPSLAELEERWKTSAGEMSDGDMFTEDSFAEDTATTPDEGRSSDGTGTEEE